MSLVKHTIHVIKESGTRFEYTFDERLRKRAWPDSEILAALGSIRTVFGYNKTETRPDPEGGLPISTSFGDRDSGLAWDNPTTLVIAVDEHGKELRRLKGPASSTPKEQSDVEVPQAPQPVPSPSPERVGSDSPNP